MQHEVVPAHSYQVVLGAFVPRDTAQRVDQGSFDRPTCPATVQQLPGCSANARAFDHVLQQDPIYFIELFTESNNYEDAVPLLEQMLEEDPNDYASLLTLARIYFVLPVTAMGLCCVLHGLRCHRCCQLVLDSSATI